MHFPKLKSTIYLFYLLIFTFGICACGTDVFHDGENKKSATGAYQPELIFPDDIPREDSTVRAITGIDCDAAHLSTIEFTFMVNGASDGPHGFACRNHEAYIEGIPAGTGIRVDVYAYNDNQAKVLYGFEMTDIHAGQVTEGGDIEMKPIDDNQGQDQDGDGFSPPQDCDDTNEDINPNAPEILDNNVDENCDGHTEVSTFNIADLNMQFAHIPAGEFDMGSPPEETGHRDSENPHRVRLTRYFYLQTTEVTQGQWRMAVNEAGNTALSPDPSQFNNCGDDCPVERINWDEVQGYINILNIRYQGEYEFRLPTEAEWEYAARAGSEASSPNGSITVANCGVDPVLDSIGWYCGNAGVTYAGCVGDSGKGGPTCNGTHPVGQKNPNAWGLYDMHGNVWEWCSDWYEDTYSYSAEPVINPLGPSSGTERVCRGGCLHAVATACRSANRSPGQAYNGLGFRLVCSPMPLNH